MSSKNKLNFEYCRQLVKDNDYNRYLMSLRAHHKVQKYIWALLAFNYEIAKTREVVTETQLGLIRLQWWREEIDKIYDGQAVKDNQILPCLAEAIQNKALTKDLFETLLYAREFDLEDVQPESLEGLVNYAEYTNAPLLGLVAQVCDDRSDEEQLKHLGRAYGLIGLLRSIPFHATQSRSFIPTNLEKEDEEAVVVEMISVEAMRNLDIALQDKLSLVNSVLAKLIKLDRKVMAQANFDPARPMFQKEIFWKPLLVLFL